MAQVSWSLKKKMKRQTVKKMKRQTVKKMKRLM
jgi:hypothetical protein